MSKMKTILIIVIAFGIGFTAGAAAYKRYVDVFVLCARPAR